MHALNDTGIIPHLSTGIIPLCDKEPFRDNARMATEREFLAQRITEAREKMGLSAREVSMRATGKPDVLRDMLRRQSTPNGPTLAKIAEVLETTTDWLLGRSHNVSQPKSEVGFHDVSLGFRGPRSPKLPVYGTGYCDDLEIELDGNCVQIEQTMFEPSHVVHMISRPPALVGSEGAYGIYFYGSSMEPRYNQGEIGVVVTTPPPGPGDFVVVQLNDGNGDDVVHVLVKRLVRATSSYVELEQLNPAIIFRVERRRVTRMHRIVMSGEPAIFS